MFKDRRKRETSRTERRRVNKIKYTVTTRALTVFRQYSSVLYLITRLLSPNKWVQGREMVNTWIHGLRRILQLGHLSAAQPGLPLKDMAYVHTRRYLESSSLYKQLPRFLNVDERRDASRCSSKFSHTRSLPLSFLPHKFKGAEETGAPPPPAQEAKIRITGVRARQNDNVRLPDRPLSLTRPRQIL